MIVCHCNAVTEKQIRRCIRSGAGSLRQLARRCGAGSTCGGCRSEILQILADEAPEESRSGGQTLLPLAGTG